MEVKIINRMKLIKILKIKVKDKLKKNKSLLKKINHL